MVAAQNISAGCAAFGTAGCYRCGDGLRAGPEACDGADLGGASCLSRGFEAGALASFCVWDTTHPAFWPGIDPLRTLVAGQPAQALTQMMVRGAWWSARHGHQARVRELSQAWSGEAATRLRALLTRAGLSLR